MKNLLLKNSMKIFILIITIFRIILSNLISAWYPSSQLYDDNLLITYASLSSHFTNPNHLSLVKTMSYPIFLRLVHLTGLSYTIVLSIVWILSAILVVKMLSYITKNKFFLIFVYLFVLFTPSAFESWIGTRLYRNSIIAPFVLILFTIMLIIVFKLLVNDEVTAKKIIGINISLGFVFSFSYYIKEDGIWLLFCLILEVLVSIGIIIYKCKNKSFVLILTLCLPLLIFILNTNIYKSINYHYFGVYETNTRTEGELGKFVNNVYKIYSDNRTAFVWAPYDAIEKAFSASETLSKYPKLLEEILNTPWFGDIKQNPIRGDFLTWVLRNALIDTGLWQSEKQVSDLFHQVNIELKNAFANGILKKDNKIQILSSAGGRSLIEILHLKNTIIQEYKNCIFLDGYGPGGQFDENEDYGSSETATIFTNMNHLNFIGPANNHKMSELAYGNKIAAFIFNIYSSINPIILILSILSLFLMSFMRSLKIKNNLINNYLIITMFILAGISFAYSLGIGWFSEYIWNYQAINMVIITKFYGVGLVPIISLFNIFGLYLFFALIKEFFIRKKEKLSINLPYS